MNVDYIVYKETGEILKKGSGPEKQLDLEEVAYPGCFVMQGNGDPDFHYVENKEVKEKTPNTLDWDVTGLTVKIAGLSDTDSVSFMGTAYTSDDGELELTFEKPGKYVLIVDCGVEHLIEYKEVILG